MLNIFSLHGKYFQNHENRFTANVLFLLSESRADFLPEFLRLIGIHKSDPDLAAMDFIFQSNVASESGREIPDAEIRLGDELHCVVEAKIGRNPLVASQLEKYARTLQSSPAQIKKLICITQVNERSLFEAIKSKIEPAIVKDGTCVLLQWHQILNALRSSKRIDDSKLRLIDRRARSGRTLDCSWRAQGTQSHIRQVNQTIMAPEALTDIHGKEGALKLLLLGDARGDLRGVRGEFQAIVDELLPLQIVGYLEANFLVGEDLTRENLQSRILKTHYTIIHYAGHALQNGLVLPFADSDLDTIDFIRILNQNPPTLLVIDACNALGDPEDLDLATRLCVDSHAIFVIGTSSIVRDDLPAKVFPLFYRGLMQGRSFGQAFQEAAALATSVEGECGGAPTFVKQCFLLGDPSLILR